MILITFALPHESGRFVPLLERRSFTQRGALPTISGELGRTEIVVLHTGMGPTRASARCEEFLQNHRPEMVISAGYGGGLDPGLVTGDLVLGENYSCAGLLERARQRSQGRALAGRITTQKQVAETVAGKRQLAQETGAMVVDMETEAIHAQCLRLAIPMLSVRAISDPANQSLPIPGSVWFDEARQKPRVLALLAYLGRHPAVIPEFARFVQGTSLARERLTQFLRDFLA